MITQQEHHLTVPRSARYVTLGEMNNDIREVWFVCHGYGQLARFFMQHFTAIAAPQRLIVAPEALSRFYLSGVGGSGRIGATWMTREDRLTEIADYIAYLDTLYEDVFSRIKREQVKVHLLGFSQGTATVCRWATAGKVAADRLILWAGAVPPELDLNAHRELLNRLGLTFVLGDQDEYAQPEQVAQQEEWLQQHGINFRNIRFEGKHQMDGEVLKRLAK